MNANLDLLVAGSDGLVTFHVARRIFRECLRIGPQNLLAGLVAGLAFVGLLHSGDAVLMALLLPYAGLALALFILFLWLRFTQLVKRLGRYRRDLDRSSRPSAGQDFELSANRSVSPRHESRRGEGFGRKVAPWLPPTSEQDNPKTRRTNWWSP